MFVCVFLRWRCDARQTHRKKHTQITRSHSSYHPLSLPTRHAVTPRRNFRKTVQVIALVCHCVDADVAAERAAAERAAAERRPPPLPFLVAAPSSVLAHWAAEFARWAPSLRVVLYTGGPDARRELYERRVREIWGLVLRAFFVWGLAWSAHCRRRRHAKNKKTTLPPS